MAENLTLARPYAEAAFQLARDSKALPAWKNFLDRLVLIVADERVRAAVGNPKLSASALARFITDIGASDSTGEQKNFVQVLAETGRLPVASELRDLFVKLKNTAEKTKLLEIESAFPLDKAGLDKLVNDLKPKFGQQLEVLVSVNPALIGGVRITVGDEVIDASVRAKLARMDTALKS